MVEDKKHDEEDISIGKCYDPIREVSLQISKNIEKWNEVYKNNIANVVESIKPLVTIQEQMRKAIEPMLERLSVLSKISIDKVKINIYRELFQDNIDFINQLKDETIFPPIKFIAINEIEFIERKEMNDWILSEDVKTFYKEEILCWKNKYDDEDVKCIIDEIYKALQNDMCCSICFLIFPLIERMLREEYFDKEGHESYGELRKVLKTEAFDVIGAGDLYKVFIKNNLYCDTRWADEFSRHVNHGVKLNLLNPKVAMNMIFLYDFLQEIIIFKKKYE